ncbi:TIGR00266 family protein [Enterococcus sp. 22-H-5-01]|uniref:TIGR00266 family protein n=1 Tax=Enterococcus sp. 22-H-5-01 TaxID=3418555 RepID=UPI003D07F7C4
MSFCQYCGTELTIDTKFCPGCGSATTESEETIIQSIPIQETKVYSPPKEIVIRGTDQFPLVEFVLSSDSKVLIESGAMVYHNGNVRLEGRLNNKGEEGFNGLIKAVGRSVVSGETMFITEVYGTQNEGRITIAPPTEGKLIQVEVGEKQWYLNDGVFLASTNSVSYDIKSQTMSKALFGGTGGLFIQETRGEGQLFFSAYGEIEKIEFDETKEQLVVDNEHVVAWQTTLDYSIETASGSFGAMTGEGAVLRFHEKGTLFIQTRSFNRLKEKINID